MAIIGKIRRNSWILILSLSLALLAFVLMDLFSSQNRGGVGGASVGTINGQKVDYQEFNQMEEALYSGSQTDVFVRRNYLWNYFLNSTVSKQQAEKIGLTVPKNEMEELEFGTNLSPIITTRFADPNTGQVNREQLNAIKTQIESGQFTDPQARRYWHYQENEIMSSQLESKLSDLVAKGFYTPMWQAEDIFEEQNVRSDFEFVRIPYSTIPENEVSVSDSEIKSYIDKNKSKYERKEEERTADYISFEIVPTSADSAEIRGAIINLIPKFNEAKNDSLFLQANEGQLSNGYVTRDLMDPLFADQLFSASVGEVVGPIETATNVQMLKVMDRMPIPDSVDSRHILFNAQSQQDYQAAYNKADSVKNLIENGEISFGDAAREYSQGPSGPNGGELGYATPGQMVPAFNQFLFYTGKTGEMDIVATEFGVHLVEILNKKYSSGNDGILYGFVSKNFLPSTTTQDSVYRKAEDMVIDYRNIDDLRVALQDMPEVSLQKSSPITENGYSFAMFGSGSSSRDIVRWMYSKGVKSGDVSPEVYRFDDPVNYYTKNCVIVALDKIMPKGIPTVEELRADIEPILLNEKKGEKIIADYSQPDNSPLQNVADAYGEEVQVATQAGFTNDIINGLGEEPNIIAAVTSMEPNKPSKPLIGKAGVYVVEVTERTGGTTGVNLVPTQKNSVKQLVSQTQSALMKSLKDNAKVVDKRSTYY